MTESAIGESVRFPREALLRRSDSSAGKVDLSEQRKHLHEIKPKEILPPQPLSCVNLCCQRIGT